MIKKKEGHILKRTIRQTFSMEFRKTFEKKNPQWGDVAEIFYWLKDQGVNARRSDIVDIIDKCRMATESHFSQFKHLRKNVMKKSSEVNKELKQRDEQLRKIREVKETKVGLRGLKRKTEEEKIPPSDDESEEETVI